MIFTARDLRFLGEIVPALEIIVRERGQRPLTKRSFNDFQNPRFTIPPVPFVLAKWTGLVGLITAAEREDRAVEVFRLFVAAGPRLHLGIEALAGSFDQAMVGWIVDVIGQAHKAGEVPGLCDIGAGDPI